MPFIRLTRRRFQLSVWKRCIDSRHPIAAYRRSLLRCLCPSDANVSFKTRIWGPRGRGRYPDSAFIGNARGTGTYGREDSARTNMNAPMYRSLQRSWALTRKRRAVDKRGLAVALTFLVALFVGIRACSNPTPEQVSNALQGQTDLSADLEIRSAGKMTRVGEPSGPVQSMTGKR